MEKIDEKVLQDIFDNIVHHFEWAKKECHCDMSSLDFNRYLIGARYALDIAFDLDSDSRILMEDFFERKFAEYFEGKNRNG